VTEPAVVLAGLAVCHVHRLHCFAVLNFPLSP
jgi:hypothetical protein